DAKALAKARGSLEAKHREDPDFWSAAGLVELTMYEALAAGKLADRQADVMEGFAEVRRRRSHTGDWESVAAQAAFVLQRWAGARAASSAREAAAAKALLARLEQYAQ
ncbi:MAG: hypothetical protein IT181_02625, partial [Acidobacteria bacterium]|nr:hypothetical protein [Acidobacteriota bacterium]